MPEHLSNLQLAGATALAVASAAGLAGLLRILRRARTAPHPCRPPQGAHHSGCTTPEPLPALPRQRRSGPHRESVNLTPAERAAFAGLMRRLHGGH